MRKLKRSKSAVLSLVLKGEWYDMIERGEKKEEYRDATDYWNTRISNWWQRARNKTSVVAFSRGRRRAGMFFTASIWPEILHPPYAVNKYNREQLNPKWGEPETPHYVIRLGARVELVDDRNQQRDRRKCVYYDGHGRCRVIPGEPPFTPPCRGWRRCKVYQERKGSL